MSLRIRKGQQTINLVCNNDAFVPLMFKVSAFHYIQDKKDKRRYVKVSSVFLVT